MSESVVVAYDLQQPPARVWRALTDPAILGAWLMSNDIKAVVGHRFTFRSDPTPHWDGVVHCQVLELEAPRKLSYSWRTGTLDTVVSWTLTPTGAGGTRLDLVQSGFTPTDRLAFDGAGEGWRSDEMSRRLHRAVGSLTPRDA